ncbi:MAG: hypothetical protein HPY44_17980 [Armatimonadetes bacterium]|nr:hypothetical protein [Armatimonadota bacterium]
MVDANEAAVSRNQMVAALNDMGEYIAAGYMKSQGAPPVIRFAEAVANHLAHVPLPEYGGESFYPCSASIWTAGNAVDWHYSSCLCYNDARLEERLHATDDPDARAALNAVRQELQDYPRVGGYTHSIPNYRRILLEGLASYSDRIQRSLDIGLARGEQERIDFCRAMQIVWEGIRTFHARVLAHLEQSDCADGAGAAARDRLIAALRNVPMQPARSFYEGLVSVNFILHIDGPDDLGRFDQDLAPLFEADRDAGLVSDEEAVEWIRRIWRNIDDTGAWNVALGGLLEDGTSGISHLTHLCVRAAVGMRRPNLALRLHRGAPQSIWDEALDCIRGGSGIPALYNEEAYIKAIREARLGVSEADLPDFAFGGCTELMVHGKSNVGSLEGDINLPLLLVDTLRSSLCGCSSFEEFMGAWERDVVAHIRWATTHWNLNQETKARWQPQVMRSLLIDDCIDNGREYNEGGARYNWAVVNVMGLANLVDSLAAVRQVVFGESAVTAEELLEALEADFRGHEALRARLQACPKFGNGDPSVNDLAERVSEFVFRELRRQAPWRGGRFVPACLMFTTYAYFGKPVAATPDGRLAGEPIADSAGAYQGRDRSGPTCLLSSVSRVRHDLAPGTLVVNARFSRRYFDNPDQRRKLQELIQTYFELGGMQLQVNVVDQAVLQDAYAHPERHGDLIIRVGGYSEYWTRLDDDLRRAILERIEHE